MGSKKKSLNIFLYTLFVVFFGFTLENSCNAVTLDDYQLTNEIMEDIVNEVGLGYYYSGDYIPLLTDCFNTMMRTVRARGDGHLVTLADCIFAGQSGSSTSQTYLQVSFINWRDNDMEQRAFYENNHQPYTNLYSYQEDTTITGNLAVYDWLGWTYDSNNNITGFTSGALPRWQLTQTSFTHVSTSYLQIYQPTINSITSGDISINKLLILKNSRYTSYNEDVLFASRTNQWGYGFYIYSNVLYLEDYDVVPTLTPTPTPSGSGGGGSSTDLTTTNNLIGEVVSSLNDTPSGDDFTFVSSGDLISSVGIDDFLNSEGVRINDNFWAVINEGLRTVLLTDVRYYPLEIFNHTYMLDNRAFMVSNENLRNFLSKVEIACFAIVEYKIFRKVINLLSSGVFSQIFRAYSRFDISDLF